MSRIRILPDHLINQIAAGEVIERPASVLKELLENSLDAGAHVITIDIESGGRQRIRVADDGEGLDHDDLLLALERHATSKLREAPDLGRIVTLGFRGEALPAIASVSRLTLTSSRDGLAGARVEAEAGRVRQVAAAGHPRGTTVDVRDLFFNTPARAKFLKSPQTELGHISELVAAYAVRMPSVSMTLSHQGRRLIEAAPSDELERIRRIFGKEWGDAISFQAARSCYTARGLLLPPEMSGPARRTHHLYVNGRLVRDRLVGHAIFAACKELLPKDRQISLFLFISCPPEAVDVNVHPAKAEVRFGEPRIVHDLVMGALLETLKDAMPIAALGHLAGAPSPLDASDARGAGANPFNLTVQEAMPRYVTATGLDSEEETSEMGQPALRAIGDGAVALAHYRESYIVAQDREGLLVIDQHAAHERILYERIVDQVSNEGAAGRQRLLFPFTAQLPRRLGHRISDIAEELGRLGVTVEPFGEETLKVTEALSLLDPASLPGLIDELLEQMEEEDLFMGASSSRVQKLLATVACHAAIKIRMPLTLEKMNYLIKELFRTASPLKCPHGRPAVLRFSQAAIEKGFDRR